MSSGMSSELQEIMRRRLARCEEVPADEQMQDERAKRGGSTSNQNRNQDKSQLSITTDTDTAIFYEKLGSAYIAKSLNMKSFAF